MFACFELLEKFHFCAKITSNCNLNDILSNCSKKTLLKGRMANNAGKLQILLARAAWKQKKTCSLNNFQKSTKIEKIYFRVNWKWTGTWELDSVGKREKYPKKRKNSNLCSHRFIKKLQLISFKLAFTTNDRKRWNINLYVIRHKHRQYCWVKFTCKWIHLLNYM